jgi:dienelactone hydrolase
VGQGFTRQPISFESKGSTCRGYLYVPEGATPPLPCVVMAHGFSGTMDWILPDFAERFAAGGLAVLIFDYRHLGESDGEPRQLIDAKRQRADLRRAIRFARARHGIDPNRIALWGTSLGGSHVVEVAATDQRIAAVVANVPALDVWRGANLRDKTKRQHVGLWEAIRATARLFAAAIDDSIRGALGLPPRYIRVFGRIGEAVFADPALADRFRVLQENSPSWRNQVTPRFLLKAPRYRDGTMERIAAPILFTLARDDVEVSSAFVKAKASNARKAEIKEYLVEHFDVYHGAVLEQVAADQLEFLQRHLLSSAAHGPSSTAGLSAT